MANARITLPIEGMTCGACAMTVQKRLLDEHGVQDAAVNYATGKSTVTINDSDTSVARLVAAVRDAGFDCAKTSITFSVEGLHCSHYRADGNRLRVHNSGASGGRRPRGTRAPTYPAAGPDIGVEVLGGSDHDDGNHDWLDAADDSRRHEGR